MMFLLVLFMLGVINCDDDSSWAIVGNPLVAAYACNGSSDIRLSYEPGRPPGEENEYTLFMDKKFPISSKIYLQFDSDVIVTLVDKTYARIFVDLDNRFRINFFKSHDGLGLGVKGKLPGVIPYVTSVVINTVEYCKEPWVGSLDQFILGYKDEAMSNTNQPDQSCGRRKVTHTELIVNGAPTKPGDWPWHVAIYRLDGAGVKYICGGTLISKSFVLTAAHCVTMKSVPVVPEILSVVLGKYNLIGGDPTSQEREVHQITTHNDFKYKNLDYDIALLKLKTEVVFDEYIQPACLWYDQVIDKLPTSQVYGTVVGWGFDQNQNVSPRLLQATLPMLPESTCIKSDPVFYGKILNDHKFCAGYRNGTSPCNGDSGGGFVVFVPDTAKDTSPKATGAWYIRGIVSVAKSRSDAPVCDPEQNVVFTDVSKYKTWVQNYVKDIK